MGRVRSMLYVHPTGPPEERLDPETFAAIRGAVPHGRHLKLVYDAGSTDGDPYEFVLEPNTLAMVRGTFYLLGVRNGYADVRSYSVFFAHPTQSFEPMEDGRLEMAMTVRDLDALVPWVRSFGPDVEVLAPPMLAKKVGRWTELDS